MIRGLLVSGIAILLGILCGIQALAAPAPAYVPEPDEAGTVRTAVLGRDVVEIPVRYLGVIRGALGPGLDLHVVELQGDLAAEVGIADGMSGSPVYFGDALFGALAYRLGSMPRQAVGGVVPIADVRSAARAAPVPAGEAGGEIAPIASPVVLTGAVGPVREWLVPRLAEFGLAGAPGGGGAMEEAAPVLEPGSPVGVRLIGGDMQLAATGTVTLVEGDTVYAFGHSFLGTGAVEFPMVSARVVHTLRDMLGSAKLTNIGGEVGAVLDDRLTAVVGRLGARADTLPVNVMLRDADGQTQALHYDIARHSTMTPVLFGAAVANGMLNRIDFDTEVTVRAEGRIRLDDGTVLPMELSFTGGSGAHPTVSAAARFQLLLQTLYGNRFRPPGVEGIELDLHLVRERREFRLERILYDRRAPRAGDELQVTCVLSRWRGEKTRREIRLRVPETVEPGTRLALVVGGTAEVENALGRPVAERLRSAGDLDAYIRALGERKPADLLRAVLVVSDPGAAVAAGESWKQLPPSAADLLGKGGGTRRRTRARIIAESEIRLPGPLQGMKTARLEVGRTVDGGSVR